MGVRATALMVLSFLAVREWPWLAVLWHYVGCEESLGD